MTLKYKCPYCGKSSYSASTKKTGSFTSWTSVTRHISKCKSNDKTYIICPFNGPISVYEIENTGIRELKKKYPYTKFRDKLKYTNISKNLNTKYTKEEVISYIKNFYELYSRIPEYREFDNPNNSYPTTPVVKRLFGTWNNAIIEAGFTPSIQNGFGVDTYGLDGHLYRSKAEAYFADNYLYGKYTYEIEPKYPKPYNRYYDWYINELDLYIELDGGVRPDAIVEKIKINKLLNRRTIFITTTSIYNNSFNILQEMRASEVAGTAC